MSGLSDLETQLAKLAAASAPEPELDEPGHIFPEVDATTRAARERIKQLMPGAFLFCEEMTPPELQRKIRENRKAMVPPSRNPWLDPYGERRSIWDRES